MYNPQLDTFLRVADAGSFNKAAELSYITPTAVIKQINLLEADLDVKLFERTHRGLKLTKAGVSLYNDTKYIIQYCRKGKYTPFRIAQTILVALILASMLGSMFSGIVLSRHVFSFMEIRGGMAVARTIHMAAAYWGFVLMSLHLGFHWSMLMGVAHRWFKGSSAAGKWMARIIAAVIAGYGLYAFIKRDIGSYMLLQVHFVFF